MSVSLAQKGIYKKPYSLPRKTYLFGLLFLAIIFTSGMFVFNFFTPDFIFQKINKNYFDYMTNIFWNTGDIAKTSQYILFWITTAISFLLQIFTTWTGLFFFLPILSESKWRRLYCKEQTEIIDSCDVSTFTDKVAILIPVCNDFLPDSILKTASQTYKNVDVWISDDSNNPEVMKEIDDFAKEHKFNVFRRDAENKKAHPNKIANTMNWISKHGHKYDYVLENDSSSYITNTFVENALCYHHADAFKDIKIGAIICNGGFYNTKNFISNIVAKSWHFQHYFFNITAIRIINSVTNLNGWCTFYKVSTLSKIPLKEVECSVCDAARGIWLLKHGYMNIYYPFDFGAKMNIQNIEGYKNQRLKWNVGDFFINLKGLIRNAYPSKTKKFLSMYVSFQATWLLPMMFLNAVFRAIVFVTLNIFYLNFTVLLIYASFIVLVLLAAFIFIATKFKINPFVVIWYMFWAFVIDFSILLKKLFFMFRIFAHKTKMKSYVTSKKVHRSTFSEKLKMSAFDLTILLVILTICLPLTFTVGNHNINEEVEHVQKGRINAWSIWLVFFPIVAGPSLVYVLLVWFGEIKIKKGYDHEDKNFKVEECDFRYWWWIKDTEIWKKQHPVLKE